MVETPATLTAQVEDVIRKLKSAGLNAQPLERAAATSYTSSSEWLGDVGQAVRAVEQQGIRDEAIRGDLARILRDVHKVWPDLPSPAKNQIHPELRRAAWLNRYVGVPLMGLIALGVFRSVLAAGVRGDEDWPLLLLRASIGALFVWAAAYAWASLRWYRRVSRLVQETDPIRVHVRFGWAEHALVATVTPLTVGQFQARSVLCHEPSWKVEGLEGTEILGYVDPDPLGPIVLRTTLGLIWPLERGRAEIVKT